MRLFGRSADLFKRNPTATEQRRGRAIQQERIINHEFPWLWAVRDRWYPGFGEVVVQNCEDNLELETFLGSKAGNTEVWIRCGGHPKDDPYSLTKVKRIKVDPERNLCWAEAILSSEGVGEIYRDIVVIIPLHAGRERVVIYRSKKSLDLNQLSVRARQLYEKTA